MKRKTLLQFMIMLLSPILVLFGSQWLSGGVVHAKELNQVVTKLLIWDDSNGREATKDANNKYTLVEGVTYSLQTGFDLTTYDRNLQDGDKFSFTISPSLTVNNGTIKLVDKDTSVEIGEAVITTKGTSQGADVVVTLKNLSEFLKKKNATDVTGVKGTFFVKIMSQTVGTGQSTTVNGIKDTNTTTIFYDTIKREQTDNSDAVRKENFAKYGGVLAKRPYQSDTLGISGDYVHPWRIRLNAKKSQYNSYVVKDSISAEGGPMQFIPEKFKLTIGESVNQGWQLDAPRVLEVGKDYTITFNAKYTEYTLTILNPQAKPYMLDYETTAPADGSTVGNIVSVTADGKKLPISDSNKTTDALVNRFSKIVDGGTIQLDINYRIVIYKVDEDTNKPLKGAQFEITKPDGSKMTLAETDEKGRTYTEAITEAEAKSGNFVITEVKAPEGYIKNETPITTKVGKDGVVRTIANKRQTLTDVSVKKVWNDANNQDGKRPIEIAVSLNKTIDGVTSQVDEHMIRQADNWQHTFTNLPLTEGGKTVTYSVTENQVDGYATPVITGNGSDGFTITNTRIPETVELSGTKSWNDNNNQDGKRPASITVKVKQEGAVVDTLTVTPDASGNWNFRSKALPKYANGQKIVYALEEEQVTDYDVPVVSGNVADGFTITNTHIPEKTSLTVSKVWNDASNQDGKRPSEITVRLQKTVDGVTSEVAEQKINAAEQWKYIFTNLPKYETGKEIVYSVTEDAVTDYSTAVNGYEITNTYTPENITIAGSKTWDDANDQDGKRPSKITVRLLADGAEVASQEVTAANNWAYNFANQAKYKNGQEIAYTITEDAVEGYTTTIDQYNVTNKRSPEKIDVTVTKTWNDADNQDGKRPSEITVSLVADGDQANPVATKTITADAQGKWTTSFTDLPKYKAGKEIKYTVLEKSVNEYQTEIKDFNIINNYTPKVVDYKVTKIWNDADNQDGKRPSEIMVRLQKTVGGIVSEVTSQKLTAATNWEYTFTNLPKYEAGQEISYSVIEDAVAGYTSAVQGNEITNVHTPETVAISGSKKWDDNNNQDGKRPNKITIRLLADGTEVGSQEVSADANGNWNYQFAEQPKYKAGNEIVYTLVEEGVADYTSEITAHATDKYRYTITNKHTPEKGVNVNGRKIWDDDNNKDGIRPSSITVYLYANGKEVANQVINEAGSWQYHFDNLERYVDGKEIIYTVGEDKVIGYELHVNGYDLINHHDPVEGRTTSPSNPSHGGSSADSGSAGPMSKGKILPQTGETSSFLAVLGSSFFLALVSLLLTRRVKN